MRRAGRVLAALVVVLGVGAPALAGAPLPVAGDHAELDCDDCHRGDPDQTPPADCWECHEAAENPHPVGVVPPFEIPSSIPLSPDGALLCRSCHRLHGGDPANKFLAAAPGVTRLGFCTTCHGLNLDHADPHKARKGRGRCEFCHRKKKGELVTGRGTARLGIKRLCNFCHDVLAKGHPRNVDPDLSLPDDVPLEPDGSWSCFTCHNPHGTTSTTHLLRPALARHLERGVEGDPHVEEYFACQACHTTSIPAEIRAVGYALRYNGDINILCISCHVTDKSHHPTGLVPPPEIRAQIHRSDLSLPLSPEGEITCYTCHDNRCVTGHQTMTKRFYDRGASDSRLCGVCHDREALTQKSPHVSQEGRCTVCHVRVPVPGVTELVTIPRMVCLRCHEVMLHPAGADHIVVPSEKISVDPDLPLGPGGVVTCPTCHDPHQQPEGEKRPYRLRAEPFELCSRCHSL